MIVLFLLLESNYIAIQWLSLQVNKLVFVHFLIKWNHFKHLSYLSYNLLIFILSGLYKEDQRINQKELSSDSFLFFSFFHVHTQIEWTTHIGLQQRQLAYFKSEIILRWTMWTRCDNANRQFVQSIISIKGERFKSRSVQFCATCTTFLSI